MVLIKIEGISKLDYFINEAILGERIHLQWCLSVTYLFDLIINIIYSFETLLNVDLSH